MEILFLSSRRYFPLLDSGCPPTYKNACGQVRERVEISRRVGEGNPVAAEKERKKAKETREGGSGSEE